MFHAKPLSTDCLIGRAKQTFDQKRNVNESLVKLAAMKDFRFVIKLTTVETTEQPGKEKPD